MITIPQTVIPAQSAADFEFTLLGADPGKPVPLAPTPSLDASWAGVHWLAWTESGTTDNYTPPAIQNPSDVGPSAPAVLRVRVVNPTAAQVTVAAQNFLSVTLARAI